MTNPTGDKKNKRLRRGLVIMYAGLGFNLFGFIRLGSLMELVGLILMAIGVGIITADYIYPTTSEEITNAVEKFEEK